MAKEQDAAPLAHASSGARRTAHGPRPSANHNPTQHHHKETALDALSFYSRGLSNSEDCGIIFQPDGTVLYVNDAYLDRRGQAREEILGRNIFELIEPSEVAALKGTIASSSKTTHMAELVLRMRTRDGSGVRQLRWQGMEILTPSGQSNLVVAQGKPLHPLGEDEDESAMGFTITPAGAILDISAAICSMCGYTREEVLATNTGELYYSPEDRRTIKTMLRRGGIERGQVTLRCKNGAPISFLYTAHPVRDASGRIRAFSGYFLPSGFPHTNKLSKDFSPVVHALPDIAWVQGRDHRIVTANDAYCAAFGLSRTDITGRTESEFLPEDLSRPLIQTAIQVFQERREITTPLARHFTGEDKWYRIVRRPVFDEASQDIIGLIGICKDITDEVEKETTYMHSLMEHGTDSLLVIDSEGRIIRTATSKRRQPILGATEDGRVQDITSIVDLLHPKDLPRAQEAMRRVLSRKRPVNFECDVRYRRRRFSTVFIRAHYNDTFFGEPRMYVTVRDLSRAKLLRSPTRVLERLKTATQSATYKELAAFLNVSSASISNAKKNRRVPPDWLVTVGIRTGTSLDWLLTGLGTQLLSQTPDDV